MKRKLVRYILFFLSGFLLMMAISFYMDYSFEEEILDNLADHVRSISPNQDSETILVTALNTSNFLEERTSEIFKDKTFQSFKVKLMSTSFDAYNFGGGACGSYTLFLARLLKKMGYKVKIVQLKVNGVWGAHNTLGVEQGNRLLLLDPLFNCSFKDSAGHLSDIHQVASNWPMYSKQLPKDYNLAYDYQSGWRYTNWDKFGFLSRSAYKIGAFFVGKSKMDNLSVHYYYLGITKMYFYAALFFFFLILIILIKDFRRSKKRIATISIQKPNEEEDDYVRPATHSA